jgi:hypothetical protein
LVSLLTHKLLNCDVVLAIEIRGIAGTNHQSIGLIE